MVEEDLGLSVLRDMLSMVIEADRRTEGRPYLSVVLSFARNCAEDIAGILPRKQRLILRKYSIEPPNTQVHVLVYCTRTSTHIDMYVVYTTEPL